MSSNRAVVTIIFRQTFALVGAFLVLGAASPVFASAADQEIQALIADVKRSDCTFVRNGSAHGSAEAAEHIERKYDYYKKRIKTAEDFIRLAATGSALSGKPYEVRCPDAPTQSSAAWLKQKLAIIRANERR